MRRSFLTAISAVALAAVAAGPAALDAATPLAEGCRTVDVAGTPADASDDVTLCEQQLFVRAGDAPISTLASAEFSTEAPTTAGVGGAGVGTSVTDIAVQGDPAHGLEVSGSFTGMVDTFDLEIYMLSGDMGGGNHGETPQIEINGFNFGGDLVDIAVEAGPNNTSVLRFGIDNMLELWPLLKFSTDADAVHTVRVNLSPYYVGDGGAYLYDGTDVPSNIVLNKA